MPILKDLKAPNGAQCSLHQVLHMETNLSQTPGAMLVRVASYVSEAEALAELPAHHWPPQAVPFTALDATDLVGSVEQVLIAARESPFIGGSRVGPVTDLEQAKARRWGEIKQLREAHEFGPLMWDGSTFDADAPAQLRIMGAVQMAAAAAGAGQPFAIDWTLADNSIRTLTGEDMQALGEALAQRISAVHETARQLREQIEAAASVQAVQSVDWPQS